MADSKVLSKGTDDNTSDQPCNECFGGFLCPKCGTDLEVVGGMTPRWDLKCPNCGHEEEIMD
jgi:primosomal protein N'